MEETKEKAALTPEEARKLLTASRAKIDSVDRKIVDLLNDRTRMVEDIGRSKMVLQMPIKEPNREEAVYRNALLQNKGPIPNDAVQRIFEQIMREMRELQGMRRAENDAPDDKS